jgi:probable F420-dependent oxidoreductase
MELDVMARADSWQKIAGFARGLESVGISGMLFTETGQVPWMMIAAAAQAAPSLHYSTGIAVAFPRSPMISAQIAWELAANTKGRFRLGLGSQVKPHIVRRYVLAVKACFRAFRGEGRLDHDGAFYKLNLLTSHWSPPRHDYEDIKVDMSAVNPLMLKVAGEVADGLHVHPMHSMQYIQNRVLPAIREGAESAGRALSQIDLIVPVLAIAGDTPDERRNLLREAKATIGFYGATPGYAFQFDDLGYEGMRDKLSAALRDGGPDVLADLVTDEMLEQFALVARWDDMADKLVDRYKGKATRVVMYLARTSILENPANLAKWGEIARAVRAA